MLCFFFLFFFPEANCTPSGKKTVTWMRVAWIQMNKSACPAINKSLSELFSLCLHFSLPTLISPTCFILLTNVYHFAYIWVWLRRVFKGQDWLWFTLIHNTGWLRRQDWQEEAQLLILIDSSIGDVLLTENVEDQWQQKMVYSILLTDR